MNTKHFLMPLVPLLLSVALLSGCSDDDDTKRSYQVNIVNLTANQPLSPIAVILHKSGYHAFNDGSEASLALETLAEGGDNSALLTAAKSSSYHLDSTSGTQPLGPGATEQFQLTTEFGSDARLSILSMLVNTNDAFTGSNAADLNALQTGHAHIINLPAWDAGTEANSEADGTMPGPADSGEGFNAARDDIVNFVGFHRGVVSSDDGLATSVLNESHRFDNPAARVTITRTQ